MANKGHFELSLIDVEGKDVSEQARVSFHRVSGARLMEIPDVQLPGPRSFELPAFPQERLLFCRVIVDRYRQRSSDNFLLTNGEIEGHRFRVMEDPDRWRARFTAWSDLPNGLEMLRTVLSRSPRVVVKDGDSIGKFTEARYDKDHPIRTSLAKASLLNLFARLGSLNDPTEPTRSWFSLVREVLVIDQERFVAIVDDKMASAISTIKKNIQHFEDYKHRPAGNHLGNFPPGFGVASDTLQSIKSKEKHGNIQLTVGRANDPTGGSVALLDADIDENGKLIAHLANLFKHAFNGGTPPYDIHEYLHLDNPGIALGYELV